MEKSTKPIDDQTVFEVKHESTPSVKSSLHGDRLNFSLLISLYIIQGIPVGLFGSISMILQASGMMTYRDQVSSWDVFYVKFKLLARIGKYIVKTTMLFLNLSLT